MTVVTIHKAKTELSKLIARAEAGELIEIARRDEVVATLVPKAKSKAPGKFGYGSLAHLRDKIPANLFLEPMSEQELRLWDGNGD